MKFIPGDPVWARFGIETAKTNKVSPGEYAAVVNSYSFEHDNYCVICRTHTRYSINISVLGRAHACPCALRPRRDDYQQREGTVSMNEIRSWIKKESEGEVKEKLVQKA